MPGGEFGVAGDHAELLLLGLRIFSRSTSQPSSNLPLYLSDHSFGHLVRGVGGSGREVHEERFVGRQRLLLPDPGDRVVGEILGQRVTLLGRRGGSTAVVPS